jgi:hypothetical protein
MFSSIVKKVSVGFLLATLLCSANLTVFAEEDETESAEVEQENNPAERVRIIRNLGQFFGTFFDLDNSFRFYADDIFIKNQCVRREVLALSTAKTEISDYLLDNYTTITAADLTIQKNLYKSITIEMIFLRNIDELRNKDDKVFDLNDQRITTFRRVFSEKVPKDYQADADFIFESLLEKYTPKLEEFSNCENSWTKVVRSAQNIRTQAQGLSETSQALKEAFTDFGEEVLATPGEFWQNSTENIANSVLSSLRETGANFNRAVDDFTEEFDVFTMNRGDLAEIRLSEQARLLGSGGSLGQSILSAQNLSSISGSVADSVSSRIDREAYVVEQARLEVVNYFSDTANILFMQKLVDANANLIELNVNLSAEDQGLNSLVEQVGNLQCNA